MRNPFRRKRVIVVGPKQGEVRIRKEVNGINEVRYIVEVYGWQESVAVYPYIYRPLVRWREELITDDLFEAYAKRDMLCQEFRKDDWTKVEILLDGCG